MTEATIQKFSSQRFDIAGAEINLEYKPETDVFVRRMGDQLLITYAIHDPDSSSPLDGDGMGSMYSSQRGSQTASEMQKALGLDSDWNPDLDNDLVVRTAADMSIAVLLADEAFVTLAYEHFGVNTPAALTQALWSNFLDPTVYHPQYLNNVFPDAPANETTCLKAAWEQAMAKGLLGNPFRVSIDVYDHSLVSYTVSGEGMRCRWDTASGGALWVPDAYLEKEYWQAVLDAYKVVIDEKYAEYAWQPSETGRDMGDGTKQSYNKVSDAVYTLRHNDSTVSTHASFDDAKDAALALLGDSFDRESAFATAKPLAVKHARQACEAYTPWVNGDSHFIVQEEWKLIKGDAEDDEFEAACRESVEFNGGGLTMSEAEKEMQDWLESYKEPEAA